MFTSEADAFKAAEQVFRDYVRAENAAQNGDNAANPQGYLIGTALEEDIKSKRSSSSSGNSATGDVAVRRFTAETYDSKSHLVSGAACLDISATRFQDASGRDVTPVGRNPIVSLDVVFAPDHSSLRISKMSASAKTCT